MAEQDNAAATVGTFRVSPALYRGQDLQGFGTMNLRRPTAALMASLTLMSAAPAIAQVSGAALVGPLERAPAAPQPRASVPQFMMLEGDFRRVGEPRRNGLIASVPVNPNLDIGIGRFRIGEIARPLNNTESQAMSVRPRDRAMAGIGFSLRFRR